MITSNTPRRQLKDEGTLGTTFADELRPREGLGVGRVTSKMGCTELLLSVRIQCTWVGKIVIIERVTKSAAK